MLRHRSLRSVLVAVLVAAAAPGCFPANAPQGPAPAPMTLQEIEAHGAATYQVPAEKVFQAALDALKVLGYEIAAERKEKGVIITKRKLVREVSVAHAVGGQFSATASGTSVSYWRQYTLEVKPAPGGGVRLVATPQIFENDVDISAQPVWALDGPAGERTLWQQLFAKVQTLL